MSYKLAHCIALLSIPSLISAQVQRPDILIADFESPTYGAWTTTGESFGPGPAQGALPGQMAVSGYHGHGLVNSFYKGDTSIGTLTSPEFPIERKFINFLIGGGSHPGKTGINLLVGGNAVRTATGINSEHLEWATWDVSDLQGKMARIEIFDRETGGWGHINVDDILQSDRRLAVEIKTSPLYEETYRPQFHFTAQKGWLNDPNGLVWLDGEYHLFFQHNPKGTEWGNMTWGHAVSKDLLHWQQLPNALEPDKLGTMFSGSAVIDEENTSGFGKAGEKPLVCIYTAAGGTSEESKGQPFTQCIAFSLDRGRTFTKYSGNPVLPHVAGENRDPKVVWHAPTKKWIMALYLTGSDYGLFSSPDLKKWTELQRFAMPDCSECPDFFPMRLNGRAEEEKWVFTAANGRYLVGDFDGRKFTFEGKPKQVEFGGNCYAVQTYSGIGPGNGRRIQIGWMNGGSYPQMPFNQQMSIPCELFLLSGPNGTRLIKQPVRETFSLVNMRSAWSKTYDALPPGDHAIDPGMPLDAFDVILKVEMGQATEVQLKVFGEPVTITADRHISALGHTAYLDVRVTAVSLQILVDRASLEVFVNGGWASLTSCFLPRRTEKPLALVVKGGKTGKVTLTAYPMASVWPAAAAAR